MEDLIKDIRNFVKNLDEKQYQKQLEGWKISPPNLEEFLEAGKKTRFQKGKTFGYENRFKKGHKANLGRLQTDETKKKISEMKKGTRQTEETKRKISENNSRYWKGKTGEEHHATGKKRPDNLDRMHLMWEARRGMSIKHNKVICPHCGKEGGDNVMKRWHFDNCRSKS